MSKATKYERARANCQFDIEETTETRAGMRKRPIEQCVKQPNTSGRTQTANLTMNKATKYERAHTNGQFDNE